MKKDKANVCPGCHRHCPMNAVRCKYGRTYFEKQQAAEEKKAKKTQCPGKCKHKWEGVVAAGGLAWELLTTARKLKKALCRGEIAEADLLRSLDAGEQEALGTALQKLRAAAKK